MILGQRASRIVRLALREPAVITTQAGHGKADGSLTVRVHLDADQFRHALERASWDAWLMWQRQLGRDNLRLAVETTEARLFGYAGAHRGEA